MVIWRNVPFKLIEHNVEENFKLGEMQNKYLFILR